MKKTLFFLLVAISGNVFAQSMPNDEAPEFIIEMADARLMDREEGRLAASLGTTQDIRNYGSLMVKDQEMLFSELKKLAATKNISLPMTISEKKAKHLKKLADLKGKKFDRKFLSMIKIDHKRDVRKFKKATEFDDSATKQFAMQYLPTIESHLSQLKELKKK